MQIAQNTVVSIHYTLTSEKGDVIDSSAGREPLAYLHGHNNLIPGMEKALDGKTTGDSFKVTIQPDEGYGDRDDSLTQAVPKAMFENADDIQVGMQFHTQNEHGMHIVTVVGLEGDNVIIDGNHPLAGEVLNFDVEVVEVREATEEEVAHGHAHGDGGHDH